MLVLERRSFLSTWLTKDLGQPGWTLPSTAPTSRTPARHAPT